jgi:hypothetical protein
MSIILKDGNLVDKYFETSGAGTVGDPFRMKGETTLQSSTAPLFVVQQQV